MVNDVTVLGVDRDVVGVNRLVAPLNPLNGEMVEMDMALDEPLDVNGVRRLESGEGWLLMVRLAKLDKTSSSSSFDGNGGWKEGAKSLLAIGMGGGTIRGAGVAVVSNSSSSK